MISLRSSIAGVMAIVAVVALDIAVARAVFASNTQLLIGGALPCVALQWAAFSLFRSRGRARAFWLGFMVGGSMITASFIWAMLFPEVLGVTRTGAVVKTPGSSLYAVWAGYGRFIGDRIGPIPNPFGVVPIVFRAILWSVPQVTIALVGGFMAWGIFSMGGVSPRAESFEESPSNKAMWRARLAAGR